MFFRIVYRKYKINPTHKYRVSPIIIQTPYFVVWNRLQWICTIILINHIKNCKSVKFKWMSVTEFLDKRRECDRKKSYLCINPYWTKNPMSALSTFLVNSPSWLEFRWSSMLPNPFYHRIKLYMWLLWSTLIIAKSFWWIQCIVYGTIHLRRQHVLGGRGIPMFRCS